MLAGTIAVKIRNIWFICGRLMCAFFGPAFSAPPLTGVNDRHSCRLSSDQFLPCCMECRRGLAMRILSVCLSVRPSLRLSNAWIVTKRKKDLSRFLYYMKDHLAYLTEKKNGWWVVTPSTWNFGSTGPRWNEITDFEPIFTRSASAVTLSEKVQLTLIGSPLRVFWVKSHFA